MMKKLIILFTLLFFGRELFSQIPKDASYFEQRISFAGFQKQHASFYLLANFSKADSTTRCGIFIRVTSNYNQSKIYVNTITDVITNEKTYFSITAPTDENTKDIFVGAYIKGNGIFNLDNMDVSVDHIPNVWVDFSIYSEDFEGDYFLNSSDYRIIKNKFHNFSIVTGDALGIESFQKSNKYLQITNREINVPKFTIDAIFKR